VASQGHDRPLPIETVKPALPARSRRLEELVHELKEEALVLQGEVLDPSHWWPCLGI
jgi:hypothetical protein